MDIEAGKAKQEAPIEMQKSQFITQQKALKESDALVSAVHPDSECSSVFGQELEPEGSLQCTSEQIFQHLKSKVVTLT